LLNLLFALVQQHNLLIGCRSECWGTAA